jgi:hypothetical protein
LAQSIYLVNPASDFSTYFSAEVLAASGLPAGAIMADLATTTLAAFAPEDFHTAICDENISAVDYNHPAEWIGITGKVNQRQRMIAIAREFHRRGKRVMIGGPYASLSPDTMRPHCDVLVRGEIEDISAELFADLRSGNMREEYIGGRPDLERSPKPRWELYTNERALMGSLQTSRGCPFECEFCDVIQYLGRKQRHKAVSSVLAELDALYERGYRTVFLADDNFTAQRRKVKEILDAIAHWRRSHPIDLITQVSIDAARDEELLDMCARAGLTQVFIGIETPNEESLRETKKRQNMHIDLVQETQRFIDHGIAVIGGMIVGFDADRLDVFDLQYEFAMQTAVPIFSVGALVAPEATPLFERISREGRILSGGPDVQAVPWDSNIVPRNMSTDELSRGLQRLCNALYAPSVFGERMLRFIHTFGRARRDGPITPIDSGSLRSIDEHAVQVALGVRRMGAEESHMWSRVWSAALRRPWTVPYVLRMLFQYAQIRHMFRQGSYWDPHLQNAQVGRSASSPPHEDRQETHNRRL